MGENSNRERIALLKWMHLGSVVVGMAALLASCMHTYWGRTSYFPEGTDGNTYARRLIVDVHGASGHAYTDRTKKESTCLP
jgi:hypothetical protein